MAGNGDLYVGTGTLFDGVSGVGGSGFRGDGIYRSTDMGESWNRVEGTDPGLFNGGDWSATDALVADPSVASRVWYGGVKAWDTSRTVKCSPMSSPALQVHIRARH